MPSIPFLLAVFFSFVFTFLAMPYWIRRAKEHGFVSVDVHKSNGKKVAELGGLVVVFGAVIGILSYIAFNVFVYDDAGKIVFLLASVSSMLIAMSIGLVDDLLGWKIGLRQRHKVVLTIFAAIPLIAVNSGESVMNLPFLGITNLGYLYPLAVIPIAIIGASNGFNMLAGYNGLEAGMGIITLGVLGYLSFLAKAGVASLIAACMTAALCAFFIYNKYPARVFPGDTLTYTAGTVMAIVAILGNIEKFALVMFGLYLIEFLLKARGRFKKESFAGVKKDGQLVNKYKRWYGLEHAIIDFLRVVKRKAYEEEVVLTILCLQAVIGVLTTTYFVFS